MFNLITKLITKSQNKKKAMFAKQCLMWDRHACKKHNENSTVNQIT